MNVDAYLYEWINGMAGEWPWIDLFMVILAEGVTPVVIVGVLLLWLWPGGEVSARRRDAIMLLLAVVLSLGMALLTELIYFRPRPFLELTHTLLVYTHPEAAFPSQHGTALAAFAAVMAGRSRSLGLLLWIYFLLMGFARVWVGAHYPGDLLGAAVIGWLVGLLVRRCRDELQPFAERVVRAVERLSPLAGRR